MTERPLNPDWTKFIDKHKSALLELFSSIYKEILSEDEEQKNNEEEGPNFFAIKELMKLEYQLLTKTEDCFKAMVHEWSNSKENLAQVMDMMCYENVGLKYEAILQLSLFLLMPNRSDLILSLMKRNKQAIVILLQGFELGKPDEDF